MAIKIQAINAYRPRIDVGNTVQKPELIRQLARATNMNESTADLVIKELRDLIIENLRAARGIKVEGLGTWAPSIDLEGLLDVQYRPDNALRNGLNAAGTFVGTIMNRENIGKTSDDLVTLWNVAHPQDLVTK